MSKGGVEGKTERKRKFIHINVVKSNILLDTCMSFKFVKSFCVSLIFKGFQGGGTCGIASRKVRKY